MKNHALSLLAFVAACSGGSPQPTVTPAPEATAASDETASPAVPGAANLRMRCDIAAGTTRAHPCDAIPYSMDVVGDETSCYRHANGGFVLEIRTSGDTQDAILVNLDNFTGPNTYTLDDPYARYVRVSDSTEVATCVGSNPTGPAADQGKVAVSPGPDSSCDSVGCTVAVVAPEGAPADRYDITLSCPELCETGSDLVCTAAGGGPIAFTISTDCPLM